MTPDLRDDLRSALRVLLAMLRERPDAAPLRAWEVAFDRRSER